MKTTFNLKNMFFGTGKKLLTRRFDDQRRQHSVSVAKWVDHLIDEVGCSEQRHKMSDV